jgi:hypothetical protein
MIWAAILRFDPAAVCVNILRDDAEPLPGGDGVRYRLVAQTDDHGEAIRVAQLLKRHRDAGELPAD